MKFSINARMHAAFAAALAVALTVGLTALAATRDARAHLHTISAEKLPLVQASDALNVSTEVQLRSLSALMNEALADAALRGKMLADVQDAQRDAQAAVAALDALPLTPGLARIWADLRKKEADFERSARELGGVLSRAESGAEPRDGVRAPGPGSVARAGAGRALA